MPIYEYECEECGREFDVLQKITDPDVKLCKFCNGPVRKIVSMSTFHLKGSGWYVTDYGGKKVPAAKRSKDETKTSSASSKPNKGESTSKTSGET